VLPKRGVNQLSTLELAIELYRGMVPLAQRHGISIAGGDTNTWDGPLAISITAIGTVTDRGPLTRSGGKVGDQILVTGSLGGSILGKHLDVEPRVAEALLLHERYTLHAGLDISDGLGLDAARLAKASNCGIALDPILFPISDAACRLSEQSGHPPVDHAWGDGEDFELLLAVPTDAARAILSDQPLGVPVTRIGELTPERGLWEHLPDGHRKLREPTGFQHGADE
jgi:thiamine-monophosphate kinase